MKIIRYEIRPTLRGKNWLIQGLRLVNGKEEWAGEHWSETSKRKAQEKAIELNSTL